MAAAVRFGGDLRTSGGLRRGGVGPMSVIWHGIGTILSACSRPMPVRATLVL